MKTTIDSVNKLSSTVQLYSSDNKFGLEPLSSQHKLGKQYPLCNVHNSHLSKLNWLPRRSTAFLRTFLKMSSVQCMVGVDISSTLTAISIHIIL